jgi:hypothetical protein
MLFALALALGSSENIQERLAIAVAPAGILQVVWEQCVSTEARQMATSRESAEAVAQAAMAKCLDAEQRMEKRQIIGMQSLHFLSDPQKAVTAAAGTRSQKSRELSGLAIAAVIDARSGKSAAQSVLPPPNVPLPLQLADAELNAWRECLIGELERLYSSNQRMAVNVSTARRSCTEVEVFARQALVAAGVQRLGKESASSRVDVAMQRELVLLEQIAEESPRSR